MKLDGNHVRVGCEWGHLSLIRLQQAGESPTLLMCSHFFGANVGWIRGHACLSLTELAQTLFNELKLTQVDVTLSRINSSKSFLDL